MNKTTKFGKFVEVYDSRNDEYAVEKGVVVSWSSIGSVSPDKAKDFLKDLSEAITFADKLVEVADRK